jgi:hypothetical protein
VLLTGNLRVFAELYQKTLLNAELERRVDERTEELADANEQLLRNACSPFATGILDVFILIAEIPFAQN